MQFRAYGLGFRVQHLAVWGLGFIGLLSMGRLGAQEAPYILNTHINSYGTLEKSKFLNKNPVKQTLTSKKTYSECRAGGLRSLVYRSSTWGFEFGR